MTLRCALRETKGRSSARNACSGLLGRTRTMCLTFLRKGRDRLEYALRHAQHLPQSVPCQPATSQDSSGGLFLGTSKGAWEWSEVSGSHLMNQLPGRRLLRWFLPLLTITIT